MQHPATRRGRRGPPPFAPTKAQRGKVMLYVAGGLSEPDIARAIGICQNTLRKHFSDEIATGRARKVAINLDRLEKAADAGNVTAMKHLDAKFAAAAPFVPDAPAEKPVGKKEAAQQLAETADRDTDWAGLLN